MNTKLWSGSPTYSAAKYIKLIKNLKTAKQYLNSSDPKFIKAWLNTTNPTLGFWTRDLLIRELTTKNE